MKDLIAKLKSEANVALGAIWLHIDAQAARIAELEAQQAFSIGETYANALSRIAELEAQIAAASAPVVEQQPVAQVAEDCVFLLRKQPNGDRWPVGTKLYTVPLAADTDKLREALKMAIIQNSCDMLMTGEEMRQCEAALASTALQAPVREVPGWSPIEAAPKDGSEVLLWLPAPYSRIAKARWFDLWENWQEGEFPSDQDEYCGIGSRLPTHYMPLPAAPVQQEGE